MSRTCILPSAVFFRSKTLNRSSLHDQLSAMGELRRQISPNADETVAEDNDIVGGESGGDVSDSVAGDDFSSDGKPGCFRAPDTVGWKMPIL